MPYSRSVSMGVWVNVGARDESAFESGLSHFIEHMIFKGTQKTLRISDCQGVRCHWWPDQCIYDHGKYLLLCQGH